MHTAKTIRRQLSPARCGRLLAPTNTSLGHTLTPMHRCTAKHSPQQLASPARSAAGHKQTRLCGHADPPPRRTRRGVISRQWKCTVAPGISRPKHSPQQLASPARSAAGHKQTRLCGHADPPPRRTRRGVVSRINQLVGGCLDLCENGALVNQCYRG